jgi:hypothetical protein
MVEPRQFYVRVMARFSEGGPEETRFLVRREFPSLVVEEV